MSILARGAAASDPLRRLVIVVLIVAAAASAFVAVEYSFTDPQLASWWPAAGFSAMAAMLARGRERWVVVVLVIAATGVGNLFAGREPLFALLLGIGNTIEVAIIAAQLAPRGRPARLSTLRQATGFIAVALLAAAATGAVIAGIVSVFLQRSPLEAFGQVTASHASATLVMLPLVLVPITRGLRIRVPELVVQSVFLTALVALVFWPGNSWPLTFLPLIAVLWSTFRFPMIVCAAQMLFTTSAVIVLTTLGGGPFAAFDDGGRTPVVLVQIFLLVYATTGLLVCAARADWYAAVTLVRAQEELLREGIVAADVGIVIAERGEQGIRVVARNERARRALGEQGPPFGVDEIDRVIDAAASEHVVFERDGRTFDASIAERRTPDGPVLVTIVITDATEREERERLAVESAEQLSRLNAQKDDFISAVSHELRTPVTSILGFSEQLATAPLPPEAAQAGEVIARNARRLADVIDDVLELSELSARGGPRSDPEQVDLVRLAGECARDAGGLTLARGVSVQVVASADSIVITSRPRDLTRVCANLLSNAIKFSHDGGVVTIDLAVEGDGALVRVIDRGLGIPPEHREMVWDRFARAPLESHRAITGTGLGLPIVRALVEDRLGGSVVLTDTPGGGTTVEVLLPRDAPALSWGHANA